MLALRYLGARRREGLISVIAGFSFIGIVLGVMTLIVVMAVMNGFRAELFDKILGVNGHAIVHKIGGRFEDYDDVASRLRTVGGVSKVMPMVEGQVMMSGPANTAGALVRGMRGNDIAGLPLIGGRIQEGSLEGFDASGGIAIGTRLAQNLRVGIGDFVTIINPRGKTTVFGTKPNIKQYKVVATFEIGMSEYDRSIVFMPLDEAQIYFNQPGAVTVLEMLVDDPETIAGLIPQLRQAGGPTVFVSDWTERNESFFTVLEVERNVMFIILSLIVLVAALNIISGLMMLVKDKGRDIAILRTMGATRGAVMRVFLITGASIGIVGTIVGLILGIIFCRNIESIRQGVSALTGTTMFDPNVYYLATLPAKIDVGETTSIVIMALSLSVLATVYPSWKASRLDPVEALRYE
ncbi:MAG: lipoprotein-releasing ABC transporter permease subunit [Rhizobiales bacterium]|nr:lipoprotein-releasing ABC transporter permease subunit [Hyphomicrobiales bacterium]